MLLKKALFAVATLFVLTCTVRADDGLLDGIDTSAITDAEVQVEQPGLDGLDMDSLQSQAGDEDSDQAIDACFRRFGYGHRGYGYRSYGHGYGYGYGGYNYSYRSYYRVGHDYGFHCYRPIVRVYRPVYYSWGCF